MKPVRVQLRRAKGWRMPPNTVKVDRTTRFGNPFRPQRDRDLARCVRLHTYLLGGYVCLCDTPSPKDQQAYATMLKAERKRGWPTLRGKNLACWCRLDQPCHADILLRIANKRGKTRMSVFKVGEILRYDDGPTALMEVTYVSLRHDGSHDRYYGIQCMGGYVGRYEDQVQRASPADLKTWKANKGWRSDSRPPTGPGIVGALEDGA